MALKRMPTQPLPVESFQLYFTPFSCMIFQISG